MASNKINIVISAEDKASKPIRGVADELDYGSGKASKFDQALSALGKTTLVVAGAAAAAAAKFVLWNGVTRALNIEDAQSKLRGLGHDAKSVTDIMDSALASVKGTAYALDEAATAAATAVAAGIKPGQELTKYLTLVADASTIAGTSMGEMGAIINKTTTSGRAMRDNLNQLAERGLPIFQWLQEEYGVTAQALDDMVKEGAISADRFRSAVAKNISGAALESGSTTRGAWANMQAAMARVGASIAKDSIPRVRDAMGGMTNWIDINSKLIVGAVDRVMDVFGGLAGEAGELGRQVGDYLGPKFAGLWATISEDIIPIFQVLWHNVIEPFIPVLGQGLVFAIGAVIDIAKILLQGIGFVYKAFQDGNPIIIGLAGLFGTLAAAMAFNAIFNALSVGFATLTLITIPGVMASVGALTAIITAPIVMPAIIVAAAVAALMSVLNAYNDTKNAIDGQRAAMDQELKSSRDLMSAARRARDAGKIDEKEFRRLIGVAANATGTTYSRGGQTLVGEHGPEIVNMPRGAQVIPAYRSREQSHGGGGHTVVIQNMNVNNGENPRRIFEEIGFALELAS